MDWKKFLIGEYHWGSTEVNGHKTHKKYLINFGLIPNILLAGGLVYAIWYVFMK